MSERHPMSEPWYEWLPIETAPKDGTSILVCKPGQETPWTVSWRNGDRNGLLLPGESIRAEAALIFNVCHTGNA